MPVSFLSCFSFFFAQVANISIDLTIVNIFLTCLCMCCYAAVVLNFNLIIISRFFCFILTPLAAVSIS